MNKKLVITLIVLVALLLAPVSAFAFYGAVAGELRDAKTNALWTHGANVSVYECLTGTDLATAGSPVSVGAGGTFNIPINNPASALVCVEVDFTCGVGCDEDPSNEMKFFTDFAGDTGTYDSGTYFANKGPNAVTLSDVDTQSPNLWLPAMLIAIVVVVGLSGAYAFVRKRT